MPTKPKASVTILPAKKQVGMFDGVIGDELRAAEAIWEGKSAPTASSSSTTSVNTSNGRKNEESSSAATFRSYPKVDPVPTSSPSTRPNYGRNQSFFAKNSSASTPCVCIAFHYTFHSLNTLIINPQRNQSWWHDLIIVFSTSSTSVLGWYINTRHVPRILHCSVLCISSNR
jgi:hypothetical protein